MSTKGPQRVETSLEFDSCVGCKYLKKELVATGNQAFYDYWCSHPEFKDEREYLEEFIPGILIVPYWCPEKEDNET